jgi:hypothetical protein
MPAGSWIKIDGACPRPDKLHATYSQPPGWSERMDDDRVWAVERSLWTGGQDVYRRSIDDDCLMVLPEPPFVMRGEQAIEAVSDTPRWSTSTCRTCR